MTGSKFAIVGGGMVAGYAAKQLVETGLKSGELTILSADTAIPYERPPLSKSFLAGKDTEEGIRINPEDFYREHGIEIRLGCTVTRVDPNQKRLTLQSGEKCAFEKVVIATGSRPRTLSVPGASLAGVRYLRTLDDAKAIRDLAAGAKRAVVIGGGFIGMEVASVLAQKGIETTLAMREDRAWKQFFTPEMSAFFEGYFSARGVRFRKSAAIRQMRGQHKVESVEFDDGSISCELVVAGIGAEPVTDFLGGSGIDVNNGVVVNEFLETKAPGILAAGDIANYPDVLFGKRRRVEHWDNALSQAQHCAKALTGERAPFRHVPYFFSDVFDLSYEFWGDPEGASRVVHRGDPATNSFSAWWVKETRLVAAFVMNRPGEERDLAPVWIEKQQSVDAGRLAKETNPAAAAA
ncbi:MAG TPA: FAD-dependent oxidoreductase [Bryobacteraceae bacterium]|nr:FAD-dependent oxidoreductase [Bryobacteraceae bacterium]